MGDLTGSGSAGADVPPATPSYRLARTIPGLLLCASIALPAYELSRYHPSLDALAISLILGILLRNVLGPMVAIQPGVRLTTLVFIPAGVVLYGSRLNLLTFTELPVYSTIVVIAGMAAFFMVIMIAGRALGIDRNTGMLIASGTAICGASAIAVLSPIMGSRSRETSMALIVITTVGLGGVMVYPLIADTLAMSPEAFGFFSGATLQQTGIVKLAAAHMGDEAVNMAVTVKMVRVAMLAPLTIFLAAALLKTDESPTTGHRHTLNLALKRVWFIPFFVAVALYFSFYEPAAGLKNDIEPLATICLSLALASIGLTVDFDSIRTKGPRPLLIGLFGWLAVSALLLLAATRIF